MPDDQQQRGGYIQEAFPTPPLDPEIWKLILDRSQIPEILIHTLKGEVWVTVQDDAGKVVSGRWEKRGEELMNDKGIRFFSSFLYSAMSPDKLATFITDEEAKMRAKIMYKNIIILIAERGMEFGITDANRTYICDLLDDFYFMNLTASRKGTILNTLKPMYERKEIIAPRQTGLQLPNLLGR